VKTAPLIRAGRLGRLSFGDWFYALALIAAASVAFLRYGDAMDGYDTAILTLHVPLLAILGWAWRPFRLFTAAVAALPLAGIWLYQGDLARAEQVFFLKYLLSSQTASYWSWDPKETWALIVWLNYAAWLHLRLTRGLRGAILAWWAIAGLLVTAFSFLGVNLFLSGLHSYGSL
jgi:hypothetical protein